MKFIPSIFFALLVVGMAACSGSSIPAGQPPSEVTAELDEEPGTGQDVLLLTTQAWEPYQMESGGVQDGIAVRAVMCILESIGQPYSITFLPWARAQAQVEAGQAHGFFAASQSDKRDAYAQMSEPIAPQQWLWYLLAGSTLDPQDPAFKETNRVTAIAGSNMGSWLQDNDYQIESQPRTTEQLIAMLQQGRVDAVLANELVFSEALQSLGMSADLFRTYVNKDKPLGVYFSKVYLQQHPGFLERFNAEIPECTGR